MMIKENKKIKSVITTIVFLSFTMPSLVYANNIASSQLFIGFQNLIKDFSTYLTGGAIAVGTAFTAYGFVRKSMADEMEHQKWDNRIKTTIIATIGAVAAGGILSLASGYFIGS